MDLSDNRIQRVENLVSLPSLRCLTLKNNNLTDLSSFAIQATQLTELNLAHNNITSIKNLASLTSLQVLNLSHNKIDGPMDMATHFTKLT